MYVRYSPEGGDVHEWEFSPKRIKVSHAEIMEARYNTGRKNAATWEQYLLALQKGDARARRVLLWYLMTLTHHTLRYEDTPDFTMGELLVEHTVAELREIRERVEKAPLSEEEKEETLSMLDFQITEAMAREETRTDEGKALPQTSESAIGL